jgi:dodecin
LLSALFSVPYKSKTIVMPIVKVIEVIASSEISFDDAVKNCITEVSKTIHNVDSVYVKDFKVHVKDGKPASYGVICKVSFRLDENR